MESGLVKVFLKTIWHNHGPYPHYQVKTRFQGTRLQGLTGSVVYRDFCRALRKVRELYSESWIRLSDENLTIKIKYFMQLNIFVRTHQSRKLVRRQCEECCQVASCTAEQPLWIPGSSLTREVPSWLNSRGPPSNTPTFNLQSNKSKQSIPN